jgi:3'(2'), 5'-bisphosphate nucleotidase
VVWPNTERIESTLSDPYNLEQAESIRAVRKAARLCRAVGLQIRPETLDKKDKSPVTVADFGSQALVCRALVEAFPDDPIIAEEDSAELRRAENAAILDRVVEHVRAIEAGSNPSPNDVCGWIDRGATDAYRDRFWTIDPIDGTKGFLRGEQYAIALALVVDGQVVVAGLACPKLNLTSRSGADSVPRGVVFTAVRGQGAFAVPLDQEGANDLRSVPIRVSENDTPAGARFCESVESGHSAHDDAAAIATRLGIVAPPVRMDSQAKYGVVACGEAEIYLRMPTRTDYREKIWDHAAGALIVEEAGGTVTDINGRPLEFHHGRELSANRGVIATNGKLHTRVIEVLGALGLA